MTNTSIRLAATGNKENNGLPHYTLSYKSDRGRSNTEISYEILSKLKKDNDAVIEINTSLAMKTAKSMEIRPEAILSEIRKLGLEYRYRKIKETANQGFLSLFFGKKPEDGHEIFVYVPAESWNIDMFKKIMPTAGARLYIMKKSDEGSKVLERMTCMTDNEKADHFEYIIFDLAELGRMGIISNRYGFEDIENALEII